MIGKEPIPRLITAEEAVELNKIAGTVDEMEIATEVFRESANMVKDLPYGYAFACRLATVWSAGRIQGIREERAKRKNAGAVNE